MGDPPTTFQPRSGTRISLIPLEALGLFALHILRHPSAASGHSWSRAEFYNVVNTVLLSNEVGVCSRTAGGVGSRLSHSLLCHPWIAQLVEPHVAYELTGGDNLIVWDRRRERPSRLLVGEMVAFGCSMIHFALPRETNPLALLDGLDFLKIPAPLDVDEYVSPDIPVSCIDQGVQRTSLSPDFVRALHSPALARRYAWPTDNSTFASYETTITPAASRPGHARHLSTQPDAVQLAYTALERAFADVLGDDLPGLRPLAFVPPFCSVLLNRLPDNCRNPGLVIRELLELREQLGPYRKHFATLSFNDPTAMSIADRKALIAELKRDSEAFQAKFKAGEPLPCRLRFAFDDLVNVAKVVLSLGVSIEAIGELTKPHLPKFAAALLADHPTIGFRLATEALYAPHYGDVYERKLGVIS